MPLTNQARLDGAPVCTPADEQRLPFQDLIIQNTSRNCIKFIRI